MSKLDELSYLIGQINEKVDGALRRLDSLKLDIKEERAVHTMDRADLRTKLNSISDRLETVEGFCNNHAPTLDQISGIKRNITLVAVVAGSMISGVVAGVWWLLNNYWYWVKDLILKLLR